MILVTDYCATASIRSNLRRLGVDAFAINHFSENPTEYRDFLDLFTGVILSGGQDIHPKWYGQENTYSHIYSNDTRDQYEMAVLEDFAMAGKKVLGICRGHQLINVFFGGSLHQDIHQAGFHHTGGHKLMLHGFGKFLFNADRLSTNSLHHQAVHALADDFEVIATHMDMTVEGIYSEKHKALGVQWHPEMMTGTEEVFEWLIS